jgi:transposase InsO family protein
MSGAFTTNGASTGNLDHSPVVERIYSDLTSVVASQASGPVPLNLLDPFVGYAEDTTFDPVFKSACSDFDLANEACVDAMLDYIHGKHRRDFPTVARRSKFLITDRSSPFCLSTRQMTLPPPTVHITSPETYRPPSDHRTKATTRANQLIAQYSLWEFDSGASARYLEWKYQLADVCSFAAHDPWVKLEILLHCLTPSMNRDIRLGLSDRLSSMEDDPVSLHGAIMQHLDDCYETLRSTRYVEDIYHQCKMRDTDTLPAFLSRFQNAARLFERARKITLSEHDKIVVFGSAISERYRMIATLVETTSKDIPTFLEYTQRLIQLSEGFVSTPLALNAVETRSKRVRFSDEISPRHGTRSKGFGCYRCSQGNHTAQHCPNAVADYASRCSKCGSRKHAAAQCKATLRMPCRRCKGKHMESICPEDLSTGAKNTNVLLNAASNYDSFHSLLKSDGSPEHFSVANTAISVATAQTTFCHSVDIVDEDVPRLALTIGSTTLDGLIDTGAAANFLHPDVVVQLRNSDCIRSSQVERLSPPIQITFGNSTEMSSDMLLRARVAHRGKTYECAFIICPHLHPRIIFGRPLIRAMQLMPALGTPLAANVNAASTTSTAVTASACSVGAPWIEEVKHGDVQHLQVRFPLYEQALIEPIREPLRSMNEVTERIILARLRHMEAEGSVAETTLEAIAVVVPIVLVDKQKGQLRTFPDVSVHARYRITSDLRGYNSMVLSSHGNQVVLSSTLLRDVSSQPKDLRRLQFQRSAFEIARRLPIEKCRFFSKVDISNAYNCVLLPPALRHIGAEVYDNDSGRYVYFQFHTLMQGWKYSPLMFRMVANFVLNRCYQLLSPEALPRVHLAFYQDDILVIGDSETHVTAATEIVLNVLRSLSFRVRDEKVLKCASSLTFCGYQLSAGTCTPTPSRRSFTAELATNLWSDFITSKDTADVVTWFRSVCGLFQYFYGFLGPQELEDLRELYSQIPKLTRPPEPTVKPLFDKLVSFVVNGLPRLFLGAFGPTDVLASIILTDANRESWSGMVLKVVRHKTDRPWSGYPDLFGSLTDILPFDCTDTVIVPVRIFGGRFSPTTQRQSSTFRERTALVECLEEALALLQGPTFCVADNQNCSATWRDVSDYGGAFIAKWQRLCENVTDMLWLPRTSLPVLTDVVARMIAIQTPASHTLSLNSASIVQSGVRTLTSIISAAYATDDTRYYDIPMKTIYAAARGTASNTRAEKAARLFSVDADGLVWLVSGDNARLYIPSGIMEDGISIRAYLIRVSHTDVHLGISRTFHNLRRYWWPRLFEDSHQFVESCFVCCETKSAWVKTRHNVALSSPSKDAVRPFDTWFIDHCGPFDVTAGTPKYILVFVCGFSHFVYANAVSNLDAQTTVLAFLNLMGSFGIPTTCHTDRGSAFTSELFRETCSLYHISHHLSPIAFPRCNGLAERAVGTLKTMIGTMRPTELTTVLPLILLTHNATAHTRTRLAPFEGAFGFSPKSVTDANLQMQYTQPFSGALQYYTRAYFQARIRDVTIATENESIINSRNILFRAGDLVIVLRPPNVFGQVERGEPSVLLDRIGTNIWRVLQIADLTAHVSEIPESLLKHVHTDNEFADLRPKPAGHNPERIVPGAFIAVRTEDTLRIFKVISNDMTHRKVVAKLWKPNRLNQFYGTDRNEVIEYDAIVLSGFGLPHRYLPDGVQQTLLHILGGGYVGLSNPTTA